MSEVNFGTSRPELDGRLEGWGLKTATANSKTTHSIVLTEDVMFNGIEFYAWSSHAGDNLTLSTWYPDGQGGWLRYKKTAKNWMIFPDTLNRIVLFPSYPATGIKIQIEYDNKGQSDVEFAINLFKYIDTIKLDVSQGEQGEDW